MLDNPMWLRDNCPCPDCRDPHSGQKFFQITDLPDDLAIGTLAERADQIEVTWFPDGHRSVYPRAWLTAPAAVDHRSEAGKRLWSAADLTQAPEALPEADWHTYLSMPAERLRVLEAVQRLGFALLRGVPVEEGQVLEVAESFGYVRETNYGRLFDVRVEPAPGNLAFTSRAIAPHTDNPYRDPVPTIQLLHCLTNAAEGGDSGLVDGFHAAALLRAEDPGAFAVLARTPVPFVYRDAQTELSAFRPLIDVDPLGHVREVRFNNRSFGTLRSPGGFYDAYRAFAKVLARPELMLTFRLGPGDCLIFDNTRLLHARTAFEQSGARHLQGAYADLDGLASTLAVLRRTIALDELEALFTGPGTGDYLGEPVTMAEHMLQAAALAEAAGASAHLVASALLHDLGHLDGGAELMAGVDNRHSHTGADLLGRWFGPEVTEPVRLHVAAKRYLCAVEPDYRARLSEASEFTLQVQGGPMSAQEAAGFAALPGAADAVAVRRFDDAAKVAGAATPAFAHFRPLLARLLRG
ncbi:2-trimethylaminoethylphosphonate dioxygenase [Herbidospora daliensis]|uniref:2-trimethylaminoethylphosphonate dioxygenase n=1 Tax=Herbidospora daliensis TaxID=295585 RepID=UPI0007839BE3|nr:TauD/TfdA family dioxygenase [Herbidospora daliensis]